MPRATRPPFPRLTSHAVTVLQRRYLRKDAAGRTVESPTQMFRRVAANIAQAERLYPGYTPQSERTLATQFFTSMRRLEFLPNSPTLMNAGRELQQLSACFVLPVDDSLESIFEAVKQQALIHQSGGGTGFSFSRLRPKDDRVASTSGVASGPVSFMRVFNMATEVIKQGGTRRGANMGILRVDHPDILEFIAAKQHPQELTNFNVSVGVTDTFMRAVVTGGPYPLINPRTGISVSQLDARQVFQALTQAAWQTGEPGVVFLDTMNVDNPTPHMGPIEATNPCGEQPLLPHESCTLGSINLARFVGHTGGQPHIEWPRLRETIHLAVHFLDNVLDMNRYPLPDIETITKGNRKIGLGVMGFADLLILLNLSYASTTALRVGERVMRFVRREARLASAALARTRGLFPNYPGSRLESAGLQLRNATITTVAPTGTISLIADCSAGIEPLYGISVTRRALEDLTLQSVHPLFLDHLKASGLSPRHVLSQIAGRESIQGIAALPRSLTRLFVTAHDIDPAQHVRMQAAFQRYSDSGVSKTINLPFTATREDVAQAFLLAHRLQCKGLTVYRSGSRPHQVLSCQHLQAC